VEVEDRVLRLRRIHVRYRLRLRPEQREAAERAHAAHVRHCPVARSLEGAIAVTTELGLEEDA
jgi:organic hydroperoxide reductase OsmC/OhrA